MSLTVEPHDVIALAYEAALAPQLWPQVLERVADILRGDAAALLLQDQVSGQGQGIVARLDPAVLSLQFGYYARRNPIRRGRNRELELSPGSETWRTHVVTDEHALSKPELMRSEFYNDFLRPFGIHSGLMIGLALENTKFATINVFRPSRGEQFDSSQIKTAKRLQPHLIRAFDLGQRLTEAKRLNDCFTRSLDRSQHAIFFADADARVRYANAAAEALANQNRGLTVSQGILRAATPELTRALHRLIADAAAPDLEQRCGGAMALARHDFRRPLSAIVAPLSSDHVSLFTSGPSVIVSVSDPEMVKVVPEDRLRQLFGLTPAEARIALALLAGGDPATIAKRRSLSIHTVRVHLARIMAKTATSRQAELVHLLECISDVCSG